MSTRKIPAGLQFPKCKTNFANVTDESLTLGNSMLHCPENAE